MLSETAQAYKSSLDQERAIQFLEIFNVPHVCLVTNFVGHNIEVYYYLETTQAYILKSSMDKNQAGKRKEN